MVAEKFSRGGLSSRSPYRTSPDSHSLESDKIMSPRCIHAEVKEGSNKESEHTTSYEQCPVVLKNSHHYFPLWSSTRIHAPRGSTRPYFLRHASCILCNGWIPPTRNHHSGLGRRGSARGHEISLILFFLCGLLDAFTRPQGTPDRTFCATRV